MPSDVPEAACTFEERFCAATVGRLSAATRSWLDDLIAEDTDTDADSAGGGGTFFTELKADPGALGLDSLLAEVHKLQRVRGLHRPQRRVSPDTCLIFQLFRVRWEASKSHEVVLLVRLGFNGRVRPLHGTGFFLRRDS
ncbi:hypothetical protein [Streptomyces sp. NPDC003247]|uniref:hypothetical protein n=1 Tax=Streptomyces sp. NPDC003247 TaxID=3364677 RepID=UPI00367A27D6